MGKKLASTNRRLAGFVLMVIAPFIFAYGLPTLDGRVYPDWLPVNAVRMGLMFTGLALFVFGIALIVKGDRPQAL